MKIRKGVIQGGILSPKLFNIFYDTLLDELEKQGLSFIAYADDIVIATNGIIEIKKAIITTKIWANKFKMEFNEKKSKIVVHNKLS